MLLLDEPTNDLDIETLNVLEDFLDGWPGTLVVVSHDRYFLERVTDSVWALLGDGQISMLPRGVDEYLERRAAQSALARCRRVGVTDGRSARPARAGASRRRRRAPGSAEERAARKTLARIDKQLERVAEREAELNAADRSSTRQDYERLAELSAELDALAGRAGRARAGVAGGRRAARVSRASGGVGGQAERREQRAQQGRPARLLVARRAGSASSARLGVEQRLEGAVDGGLALGGQPHDHAAPVVGVGVALDEAAGGQPVDPVGHRAAGHQGLAEQPAGGELVRRPGAAQRGEHVELPRLDPWAVNASRRARSRWRASRRDPAEHRDRRQVEVGALARPRLDQLVDLVPHAHQSSRTGRES